MEKDRLITMFNNFLLRYDVDQKDNIWSTQSEQFRRFWSNKIMSDESSELSDAEIDQIIKILDRNGRGNTKESEAVAKAMIAQGAWRRMFNSLKTKKEFSKILDRIFTEKNVDKKSEHINELYRLNESRQINNLTGPSGNAICAMLAAYDPVHNLSVISLNDRERLCAFLELKETVDFSSSDIGRKIVYSNKKIADYFENIGANQSARTISVFCYTPEFKPMWKIKKSDEAGDVIEDDPTPQGEDLTGHGLFYMESQLEDFIIENWDNMDFGKKYDLIEKDGELKSQQYPTDIGKIDILAKDKRSGQYVVIELKKNQTSDDTVGQLTRYMGWVEEHTTNGELTKGIIIAGSYDRRLYYAAKKLRDVEIYLYQVDFKLREFKE